MVHERCVKGTDEVLELRVSGEVLLGNLIYYDKASDTYWLQETGMAIKGPKLGQQLPTLNREQWTEGVRWDQWKKEHPDSKVLFCDHCQKSATEEGEE